MPQRNNLIVNYLPPSYRDPELRKLFQPYGNIIQAKVICSKTTKESLTYGFVMFEHVEDAMRALQELNGFYIFGKQLKVSIARPRDGGSKGCKLHVSKLPVHYTWEMVHSLFSQFGEIIELRVLADEFGNSRQVAFVQYGNRYESDAALSALSGYVLPGAAGTGLVIKYATQHKPKSNSDEDFNLEDFGFSLSPSEPSLPPWALSQNPQYPYLHNCSSSPLPLMESGNQRPIPMWNTEAPSYRLLTSSSVAAVTPVTSTSLSSHHSHPLPHPPPYESNESFDFRAYLPHQPLRHSPPAPSPPVAAALIPTPLLAAPVTSVALPVSEHPFRLQTFVSNSPMTTDSSTTSSSSSSSSSTTPLPQQRSTPFTTSTTPITATATATSTTLMSISLSSSSRSSGPSSSRSSGFSSGPTSVSGSSSDGSSSFTFSGFGPSSGSASGSDSSSSSGLELQHGREYLVTLQPIKPFQDVFSFPFISSFGKVLEAKFLETSLPSEEKFCSIQFLVMPLHQRHLQQLQYFQNSSILYEGITLNLFLEEIRK